jgi:hypothetical protein
MLGIYYGKKNFKGKNIISEDFVSLLRMLMLARVDGKSPVEYLVDDDEKKHLVRKIAAILMESGITDYKEAIDVIIKIEELNN